MTIGAIILSVVLVICFIGLGVVIAICAEYPGGKIAGVVIALLLAIGSFLGIYFYCTQTEEGKRAYKTQQSNFGGGIERKVTVYDIEGDVIAEYRGKFDVEYDNDRILFDDENGMRHIIYYPTGNVIIDEIGE